MVARRGVFAAMLLTAASPIGLHSALAAEDVVIQWKSNGATVAAKACMGQTGSRPLMRVRWTIASANLARRKSRAALDDGSCCVTPAGSSIGRFRLGPELCRVNTRTGHGRPWHAPVANPGSYPH